MGNSPLLDVSFANIFSRSVLSFHSPQSVFHRAEVLKFEWSSALILSLMDCAFLKNWSIVDLQGCVSFNCTAKWFSYSYLYLHLYIQSNILLVLLFWTNRYQSDQFRIRKIKVFILPLLIPSLMLFLYVDPSFWPMSFSSL